MQVLRLAAGDQIRLTDGRGKIFTAEIIDNNKKKCSVTILAETFHPPPAGKITIAISLIKNASRFEWFAEKATEIGISEIVPLVCERTEKQHFRQERVRAVLISAMLQSQQAWLPVLSAPVSFKEIVRQSPYAQKFIAHCAEGEKKALSGHSFSQDESKLLLIGPEGDFTAGEIQAALQNNFLPVSLGKNRLRTETAGMVACVLLNTGRG